MHQRAKLVRALPSQSANACFEAHLSRFDSRNCRFNSNLRFANLLQPSNYRLALLAIPNDNVTNTRDVFMVIVNQCYFCLANSATASSTLICSAYRLPFLDESILDRAGDSRKAQREGRLKSSGTIRNSKGCGLALQVTQKYFSKVIFLPHLKRGFP